MSKKYWLIGISILLFIAYFGLWNFFLKLIFHLFGFLLIATLVINQIERYFGKVNDTIFAILMCIGFVISVMVALDTSKIPDIPNSYKHSITKSYYSSESTSPPKINTYGLKPANDVTNSNDNPVTVPNQNSEIYKELGNKAKEQRERIEIPEINTPKINTSPVQNVPVYNPEHYIGIYHTGYAAYVLIDSIKPMKCTVKAIGEGNTYYIYYDFSFVNNEWHFHNSQGFDGLVTDETPIEKNIINFCKSIDWKPVRTQNINSLYDDSNDLQAAKNKLQEFHINITNKLYRQAYDCLSEAFQKKVPFDGWVKGFNTTVSSTPYNITISPESNNENVVLTYELKAVDNPGGTTYYNGTATLINTPLGWKIDRIKNKLQ